jgi:hypothetical protein
VPNGEDVDYNPVIPNLVEDAVVADPNAPEPVGPGEHPTPGWAWIASECLDSAQDPARNQGRKPLQLLSRRACEEKGVPTHEPVAVVGDGDGL